MQVDPYVLAAVLSALIVAVVMMFIKLAQAKRCIEMLMKQRVENQVQGYFRACLVGNMGATPEKMRAALSTKADPHFNMGILERIEELEK